MILSLVDFFGRKDFAAEISLLQVVNQRLHLSLRFSKN